MRRVYKVSVAVFAASVYATPFCVKKFSLPQMNIAFQGFASEPVPRVHFMIWKWEAVVV